jgi:hypothetical protein
MMFDKDGVMSGLVPGIYMVNANPGMAGTSPVMRKLFASRED